MLFVIIQFTLIIYILYGVSFKNLPVYSVIMLFTAFVIGISAIMSIGISNVSVWPDIQKNTRLVTRGPYKLIRHPMYTALLLAVAAILISQPTWKLIAAGILLCIDLILKLRYEESKLLTYFPEYHEYKKRSYYLIPYIF